MLHPLKHLAGEYDTGLKAPDLQALKHRLNEYGTQYRGYHHLLPAIVILASENR